MLMSSRRDSRGYTDTFLLTQRARRSRGGRHGTLCGLRVKDFAVACSSLVFA